MPVVASEEQAAVTSAARTGKGSSTELNHGQQLVCDMQHLWERASPVIAVDAEGMIGLTAQTPIDVTPDESLVLVDQSRSGLYVLSSNLSSARRVERKSWTAAYLGGDVSFPTSFSRCLAVTSRTAELVW